MKLSDRQLQTPLSPSPASTGFPQWSRIEASFRSGNLEQIAQWRDRGDLARAMKKEIGKKRLFWTLPLAWLNAANAGREKVYSGNEKHHGWGTYREVWEEMRGLMDDAPSQETLNKWLVPAVSLPIADQLISEGANPHAPVEKEDARRGETAFVVLLKDYIRLNSMMGQHRHEGWPRISEEMVQTKKRLMDWLDMPGMSPESASFAMNAMFHAVFGWKPLHPKVEECLVEIRNRLSPMSAPVHRGVMDLLASECAPRKSFDEANPHRSYFDRFGRQSDVKEHEEREDRRTHPDRRQKLVEWADALVGSRVPELGAWMKEDVWMRWLRLPGGHRFAVSLAREHSPWGHPVYIGKNLLRINDDQSRKVATQEAIAFSSFFCQGLNERAVKNWSAEVAASALRNEPCSLDEIKTLFGWASQDRSPQDRDIPGFLVSEWMKGRYSAAQFAEPDTFKQDTALAFAWMENGGHLEFIQGPLDKSTEFEFSEDDLDQVSNDWGTWLKNPLLREVLDTLPEQYAPRITALSPFFPEQESTSELRQEMIDRAILVKPNLIESLSQYLLKRAVLVDRPGVDRRGMWEDFLFVCAKHMPASASWDALAQALSPEIVKKFSVDACIEKIDTHVAMAPPGTGPTQLLFALIEKEKGAPRKDWGALAPILDHLKAQGADFSAVPEDGSGELLGHAIRQKQRDSMDNETPQVQVQGRRFRL